VQRHLHLPRPPGPGPRPPGPGPRASGAGSGAGSGLGRGLGRGGSSGLGRGAGSGLGRGGSRGLGRGGSRGLGRGVSRGLGRGGSRGKHRAARLPLELTGRVLAVGLVAGAALALLVFQYQCRHMEAEAAARLSNLVTATSAGSRAPIIWFGRGTPGAFGLVITPDCSSALLIAPLCGLGMVAMVPRRRQVRRIAKALASASAVMIGGDLVRIEVIALAVRADGIAVGSQVSRLVLGPVTSVICIALSLALLTVVLTARDGTALVTAVFRGHRKA